MPTWALFVLHMRLPGGTHRASAAIKTAAFLVRSRLAGPIVRRWFASVVVPTSCTAMGQVATTTPPSTIRRIRRMALASRVMKPRLPSQSLIPARAPIPAPIRVALIPAVVVRTLAAVAVLIRAAVVAPIPVAVAVLALIPSRARQVARMPMASRVQGRVAALIRAADPIPVKAVATAVVAAPVQSLLFAVAMPFSAPSFSSSGVLAVRLRGWVARSQVIQPIAKLHTSAKAMRSPAVSSLSCVSRCAAPGRGTATAHSPATVRALNPSFALAVIPLHARS